MKKKNILKAMMILFAFTCALVLFPAEVKAAPNMYPNTIKMHTKEDMAWYAENGAKLDIQEVECSKKGVLKASIYTYTYEGWTSPELVRLQPKKPGKVTVTCKYKYKGKVYTEKIKVSVYKYKNPVSSLKIDGKELRGKFSKKLTIKHGFKNLKKAKVVIKAADGWKIQSIHCHGEGNNKYKFKIFDTDVQTYTVTYKQSWKIKSITVNMVNMKTGVLEPIVINAK